MLNALLRFPICHRRPLLTAVSNPEQVSDLLLLLNFIPRKLYPLASPADSRRGTCTKHIHANMGTERRAGGRSMHTGTSLCHACKLCFTWAREEHFRGRKSRPFLESGTSSPALEGLLLLPYASTSQRDSRLHGILQEHCLIHCLIKKKITYGTKAAVCPQYVRYHHAQDCRGLHSLQ